MSTIGGNKISRLIIVSIKGRNQDKPRKSSCVVALAGTAGESLGVLVAFVNISAFKKILIFLKSNIFHQWFDGWIDCYKIDGLQTTNYKLQITMPRTCSCTLCRNETRRRPPRLVGKAGTLTSSQAAPSQWRRRRCAPRRRNIFWQYCLEIFFESLFHLDVLNPIGPWSKPVGWVPLEESAQ